MPRSASEAPSINTEFQKDRKGTQRERLIAGAVEVANREGYASASVAEITTAAGVSRPTFYEYFSDREDCLLNAIDETHRRLLHDVRAAVRAEPPERAMLGAVEALIGFASSDRAAARFVSSESMAGGSRALDARDRGIVEIAGIVNAALEQSAPEIATPDFSTRILLGGIYRLLAARLRRGEPGLAALHDDLLSWIGSYERCRSEHRWFKLEPVRIPGPTPPIADFPLRLPMALPPGRPRVSEAEVARNHRERILYSTALLAESKGYIATTIADITKLAGLNPRAFYASFAGKRDAFMTVHELGTQHVMAVTAGAFFAGQSWPERSWDAGRAFTVLMESNPTIAHVGFVEAYAVGPAAIQRVEDSHITFSIFLQEGFQYKPQPDPPSRVALEAIIATIFELVYHQSRSTETPQIAGLLPHISFLWLAPFIGSAEANEFIEQQLRSGKTKQR